jgi:hypothetical protein
MEKEPKDEGLKDEKLIKKRIPDEKRFVKLGDTNVDLGVLCRDPRDVIDDLKRIGLQFAMWNGIRDSALSSKLQN